MNEKLKQSINDGLKLKQEREVKNRELEAERKEQERIKFLEDVDACKRILDKEDFLWMKIRSAVANDEKEVVIDGTRAMAVAINDIPGLEAKYESGWDHINSDEVKEFWQWITVTWKT
jgi:hypothetical protein